MMSFGRQDRAITSATSRRGRLGRFMAALVLVVLAVMVTGSNTLHAGQRPDLQKTPTTTGPGNARSDGSSADMWRSIRKGHPETVTLPGRDRSVLIQSAGLSWQTTRKTIMVNYGAGLLAVIAAAAGLFFLAKGRIRITGGRTGRFIPRFSLVQRIVHWSVAVLFMALGLSGLILLLGRTLLKPVIGAEAFAVLASASMQGHNLFGPLFIPAILALFFTFIRGNGYRLVDLKWLLKGGGFFGGHASSHKYNFGEKTWFWWSIVLGFVLYVTGMAMLFPEATPGRNALQFANLVHAGAAILLIAFAIGHIYLGTLGVEGALEGMTQGTVDEHWAKDHHDLWYEEHKHAATRDRTGAEVIAAARGDAWPEGAGE